MLTTPPPLQHLSLTLPPHTFSRTAHFTLHIPQRPHLHPSRPSAAHDQLRKVVLKRLVADVIGKYHCSPSRHLTIVVRLVRDARVEFVQQEAGLSATLLCDDVTR